jgi:hypothetical protein
MTSDFRSTEPFLSAQSNEESLHKKSAKRTHEDSPAVLLLGMMACKTREADD